MDPGLEYSIPLSRPATTFELDPATGALATLKVQEIPSGYDAADYVTGAIAGAGAATGSAS